MNVGSDRVFTRFIPAGAGNTGITVIHWPPIAVYPRWRGEHAMDQGITLDGVGLSPLARGTHGLRYMQCPDSRFIPAGAGNTLRVNQLECKSPVYPRWRGEHSSGHNN